MLIELLLMVHENMLQAHACSMHASLLPPTVTAAVVRELWVYMSSCLLATTAVHLMCQPYAHMYVPAHSGICILTLPALNHTHNTHTYTQNTQTHKHTYMHMHTHKHTHHPTHTPSHTHTPYHAHTFILTNTHTKNTLNQQHKTVESEKTLKLL